MDTRDSRDLPELTNEDRQAAQEALGYLNFSGGKPDPRFQQHLNRLTTLLGPDDTWQRLFALFCTELQAQQATNATFQNSEQAAAVLALTINGVEPAYRRHHHDLLFHLLPHDYHNPLFLARLFEAVLQQGPPWNERERIVDGALDLVNDFLGHRPVAVLESGRQMQPYDHERFRPFPLYITGAGAADGPWRELILATLEQLKATPADLLAEAQFDPAQLDEVAWDPRAYDHQHPMYRRTNYMFGEWDPHLIDSKGRYRRFVIRSIVLDAIRDWMKTTSQLPPRQLLFEASAVLCGTMLMASAISGGGPGAYGSSISLATLLPRIARLRDAFYTRLLNGVTGPMADRLFKESEKARQPFGHVRHHLNLYVANLGAKQLQHRHLAFLYARMGYPHASQSEALVIPSTSARFETEIEWRLTSAQLHLNRGELQPAVSRLRECEELLHRGIACGGLIDPWNILGFGGNFPLFHSREDSVPDPRAEKLIDLMELIFGLYSRCLSEAAAEQETQLQGELTTSFQKLADWWDKFATIAVSEFTPVSGGESYQSAVQVAETLAAWRKAGESAGAISFWRSQVDRFESAKSYALVLEALLRKRDSVAAMGLLMQWLGHAEEVGLEAGPYSFHLMVQRWIRQIAQPLLGGDLGEAIAEALRADQFHTIWPGVAKLFDYLEANAGSYWQAPRMPGTETAAASRSLRDEFDDEDLDEDDDENDIYGAAYDNVVYRDSAHDGILGDTVDSGGSTPHETDIDQLADDVESRLRFHVTLARLWELVASIYASRPEATEASPKIDPAPVQRWYDHLHTLLPDLLVLLQAASQLDLPAPSGDHDSLVEYDRLLQVKYNLVHNIVYTHVACRQAAWHLAASLPEAPPSAGLPPWEQQTIVLYRAVLRGDSKEVRNELPTLLQVLVRQPLLYVPLDKGGEPAQLLRARTVQAVLRWLMSQLPYLGLFRQTWHVLRAAQRMERHSPHADMVITEFDRLFYAALRSSVRALIRQAEHWKGKPFDDERLIDVVGTITDFYLAPWLEHSGTMRLSTLEALSDPEVWQDTQQFIQNYGHDLLQSPVLTLGNLRGILHTGVDAYLDYLIENEDPLHPIKLLTDLDDQISRDDAESLLELIFRATVEKYDRYLEYNTTTTLSDYGEQFASFLDFLRLESSYERQAWNLAPLVVVHEVLVREGKLDAGRIWEAVFETRTTETAKTHVKSLTQLEKHYGMRLPGIADLVREKFVKPLTVDRFIALIPQAMRDARREGSSTTSKVFQVLKKEVDSYMANSTGSGVDIPPWLQSFEHEVELEEGRNVGDGDHQEIAPPPLIRITLTEVERQLSTWESPLRKTRKRK